MPERDVPDGEDQNMTAVTEHSTDYKELANQDPDFAAIVGPKGWVDFRNPKAIQALCKALLRRDYGLAVQLPEDRLTPFVPVRYRYVRWMQQLLDSTSGSYVDDYDEGRLVQGIDIGTGASAIYALLSCKLRPRWRLVGTDIDLESLTHAARNVSLNNLEDKIKLLETSREEPLIPLEKLGAEKIDFVLCNPPFYTSADEMQASLSGHGKSRPPSTICTGSESEMVTPGGDLGFVTRIVEESMSLGERVQWYSAMVGKLESVYRVIEKLKEMECTNWATHYLTREGGRTKRWAVAWSWGDLRPPEHLARGHHLRKEMLPFPSEYKVPHPLPQQRASQILRDQMESLNVRWRWDEVQGAGLALITGDVWSRRARRMKQKNPEQYQQLVRGPIQLVAKISSLQNCLALRWERGHDRVLFEQFCEMLKRKFTESEASEE